MLLAEFRILVELVAYRVKSPRRLYSRLLETQYSSIFFVVVRKPLEKRSV